MNLRILSSAEQRLLSYYYHVTVFMGHNLQINFFFLKGKRQEDLHLPINATLDISCVSVAAIFHTWKSSEEHVNSREANDHLADINVPVTHHEGSC